MSIFVQVIEHLEIASQMKLCDNFATPNIGYSFAHYEQLQMCFFLLRPPLCDWGF